MFENVSSLATLSRRWRHEILRAFDCYHRFRKHETHYIIWYYVIYKTNVLLCTLIYQKSVIGKDTTRLWCCFVSSADRPGPDRGQGVEVMWDNRSKVQPWKLCKEVQRRLRSVDYHAVAKYGSWDFPDHLMEIPNAFLTRTHCWMREQSAAIPPQIVVVWKWPRAIALSCISLHLSF